METWYDIVAKPGETPVTTPEELIVAIEVEPDVHVPPDVLFVSVAVEPVHILEVPPEIAATVGVELTVIVLYTRVPHATLYVINVVPAATPVTSPVSRPTVALATLLLLHVPPEAVLLSVVVEPVHTVELPEIADGDSETVIFIVVLVSEPLVLHVPLPVHVITV